MVVFVVSDVVGLTEVLQTTPLAETEAPPSELIIPPATADIPVMELAVFVESDGVEIGFVVKILSAP